MSRFSLLLLCLVSLSLGEVSAAGYPTEVEWANAHWGSYCPSADHVEQRQWDGTRVDYISLTHAIEIDWAYKWAEAVGQSLYYAELTGLKPGIILLVKDAEAERHFVYRCQTLCAKHGIKLWVERVIAD